MKDCGGNGRTDRRGHSGNRRDSDRQEQENPDRGIDDCRLPEERDEDAEKGRNPLPALELEPDRIEMPDESTAAVAFRQSKMSVSAARGLLPVRSTLVAPMFPDPIFRTSPLPARRVRISPNGIDPSR